MIGRSSSGAISLERYPVDHSQGILEQKKYSFSIGDTSSKGPCSIAMLVYWRVKGGTLRCRKGTSQHTSTGGCVGESA